MVIAGPSPLFDRVVRLADLLRRGGLQVSTGELIDACHALEHLDLMDRTALRAGLRATMVKEPLAATQFDRAFAAVFRVDERDGLAPDALTAEGGTGAPATIERTTGESAEPGPAGLADAVLHALEDGDQDELRLLAARAVDLHSGIGAHEGSQRYFLHRVLRAVDLTTMLTTAMQRLRRGATEQLTELELLLQRKELARLLEDFRRELAAQIADRLAEGGAPPPPTEPAMTRDLLELSAVELDELRRTVRPLARQLAARIGRRRRQQATGRLDPRTTARRSLQSGGVPLDPAWRKRHPHRPEVVVLCDVSGSVSEFAQFTFTLVHALHAELSRVRSFAFVDGIVEVTDLFATATHELHVARLLERRGLITGDGHSDYGHAFELFCRQHLDGAVTPRTTVLVTGDARTNYRPAGVVPFRNLCQRARRVYWLNPEPREDWDTDDSAMTSYQASCAGAYEVRTLRQLADAIAAVV
jgi:uncharacterized protein with von Willebrand factor type A (vWA) domain